MILRFALLTLLAASASACGAFVTGDWSPETDAGAPLGASSVLAPSDASTPSDTASPSDATSPRSDTGVDPVPPYIFYPSALAPSFADTFARPDGPPGPDWTVKKSGMWSLTSGAAKQGVAASVFDGLLLHTVALSDVQVSATFTSPPNDFASFGAVLARVQPSSLTPGRLTAYALRINAGFAVLALYSSPDPSSGIAAPLASAPLSPQLLVSHPYRLVLRVTGGTFPVIEGGVYDVVTDALLVSLHTSDLTAYRIVSSGGVGVSSEAPSAVWDDFSVVNLQ